MNDLYLPNYRLPFSIARCSALNVKCFAILVNEFLIVCTLPTTTCLIHRNLLAKYKQRLIAKFIRLKIVMGLEIAITQFFFMPMTFCFIFLPKASKVCSPGLPNVQSFRLQVMTSHIKDLALSNYDLKT